MQIYLISTGVAEAEIQLLKEFEERNTEQVTCKLIENISEVTLHDNDILISQNQSDFNGINQRVYTIWLNHTSMEKLTFRPKNIISTLG